MTIILSRTADGSVTDKTTRVGLVTGFIRYGDLQLNMVTITMSTIALAVSRILLTDVHCADVSLRGLTDDCLTH
jgi:hypothetical protein